MIVVVLLTWTEGPCYRDIFIFHVTVFLAIRGYPLCYDGHSSLECFNIFG